MKTGVVSRYGSRGFGYIWEPETRQEFWFHAVDVTDRISLRAGDKVRFEVGRPKPGAKSPVAILIEFVSSSECLDAVRA